MLFPSGSKERASAEAQRTIGLKPHMSFLVGKGDHRSSKSSLGDHDIVMIH